MNKLLTLVSIGVALVALGWMAGREPLSPLQAAEQAYHAGDLALALQIYQQEALSADDPAHVIFNRGAVLYKIGALDGAAKDFRTAIASDNEARSARSCYDLGNCALRLACRSKQKDMPARLHDAIECYDACLAQSATADQQLLDNARHNRELAKRLLEQTPEAARDSQLVKKDKQAKQGEEDCEH